MKHFNKTAVEIVKLKSKFENNYPIYFYSFFVGHVNRYTMIQFLYVYIQFDNKNVHSTKFKKIFIKVYFYCMKCRLFRKTYIIYIYQN